MQISHRCPRISAVSRGTRLGAKQPWADWITWAGVSVKAAHYRLADCDNLIGFNSFSYNGWGFDLEQGGGDSRPVWKGKLITGSNDCDVLPKVLKAAAPREMVKTYPVTPISPILHIKQAAMTSHTLVIITVSARVWRRGVFPVSMLAVCAHRGWMH